jgi:hypothetical protein
MGLFNLYKAILVMFFVVVFLTVIVFTGFKDNFYAFL